MDVGSIGAALASIKTAAELAKIIKDSSSSLEKAEIKFKLADLVSALAEAKMDIASIQELVLEKEKEISSLKDKLETKNNVLWEKPYYFLDTANGKDGPFCPACYDDSQKLIRLQDRTNGTWMCHVCKGYLEDSTYRPIEVFPSSDNGWI
jgi:hypothetical protein